jgi:hypothetical protein
MSSKNDIHNTKKTIINVHLDIEYNTYKKKMKKYIFEHMEMIFNIFTEEFNDNLIKLYILFKKDILVNEYKKYINLLVDLYKYLDSLEYIDQEEYFKTVIKLINIIIFINNFKLDMSNDKYIKLINLEIISTNIIGCVNLISKDNIITELFLVFINNHNTNSKNNIIFMGEKLSLDFFMYWTSEEIYKLITNNIKTHNNKLLLSIKKYKNDFINTYEHKTNILKKLYIDQINTKYSLKYRLNKKNKLFDDLIKDIYNINKEFMSNKEESLKDDE